MDPAYSNSSVEGIAKSKDLRLMTSMELSDASIILEWSKAERDAEIERCKDLLKY
jgi:hypothetical protein